MPAATLGTMSLLLAMVQPMAATDPLERDVEQIGAQFVAAHSACGIRQEFLPDVKVKTQPSLISYDPGDRTVRVSRFGELPTEIQGLMAGWAEAAGMADGRALFGDVFNSLLVPHELGHWMQHASGRLAVLQRWESELEANRIAIAYWQLDDVTARMLPARIEAFTGFLGRLPDPVPDGQDPKVFFNAKYEKLDSVQYGWFQGVLMQEAWSMRDASSFCELAKQETATP